MHGYTRNIYLSCIFRATICQLQATGKLTCKRSANRAALQRSYSILKVHFATIYYMYLYLYIIPRYVTPRKICPKLLQLGFHTQIPPKDAGPFPFFSRCSFPDISCSAFAWKRRGILKLGESIPLGGRMGWAAWSYSQFWKQLVKFQSSQLCFLETLELRTFKRLFDWKERKQRTGVKTSLFSLPRKHEKIYDSNTISSWFIFRWFMLP